jgi:hypothetical protein
MPFSKPFDENKPMPRSVGNLVTIQEQINDMIANTEEMAIDCPVKIKKKIETQGMSIRRETFWECPWCLKKYQRHLLRTISHMENCPNKK